MMNRLRMWTPGTVKSPLVLMLMLKSHQRAVDNENLKWPQWPTMVKLSIFLSKVVKGSKETRKKALTLIPMKEKVVSHMHQNMSRFRILPLGFYKKPHVYLMQRNRWNPRTNES